MITLTTFLDNLRNDQIDFIENCNDDNVYDFLNEFRNALLTLSNIIPLGIPDNIVIDEELKDMKDQSTICITSVLFRINIYIERMTSTNKIYYVDSYFFSNPEDAKTLNDIGSIVVLRERDYWWVYTKPFVNYNDRPKLYHEDIDDNNGKYSVQIVIPFNSHEVYNDDKNKFIEYIARKYTRANVCSYYYHESTFHGVQFHYVNGELDHSMPYKKSRYSFITKQLKAKIEHDVDDDVSKYNLTGNIIHWYAIIDISYDNFINGYANNLTNYLKLTNYYNRMFLFMNNFTIDQLIQDSLIRDKVLNIYDAITKLK